jgi:hypothetical protein
MSSRWSSNQPLTLERLKEFVALNNITAQVPLIEVSRRGWVRVWVAYDHTRTMGTFTEIEADGSVRTVTIYPSGKRNETINRPAFQRERVRGGKKSSITTRNTRRTKRVYAGS